MKDLDPEQQRDFTSVSLSAARSLERGLRLLRYAPPEQWPELIGTGLAIIASWACFGSDPQ